MPSRRAPAWCSVGSTHPPPPLILAHRFADRESGRDCRSQRTLLFSGEQPKTILRLAFVDHRLSKPPRQVETRVEPVHPGGRCALSTPPGGWPEGSQPFLA